MVAKTGRLMQRSANPTPITCLEEGGAVPLCSDGVSIGGLDPDLCAVKEFCLTGNGDLLSLSQTRNNLLQAVANAACLDGASSRDTALDNKDLCHAGKVNYGIQWDGRNGNAFFADECAASKGT